MQLITFIIKYSDNVTRVASSLIFVAPRGRDTALTQLSLSRVYASRLGTRGSASRTQLVRRILAEIFHPIQYVRIVYRCSFNPTSMHKQNLKYKKQAYRVLDVDAWRQGKLQFRCRGFHA